MRNDLANPPNTSITSSSNRRRSWTAGFYPIEVVDDDKYKDMVKVHYIGWHHRYDEYIKKSAVKSTPLHHSTQIQSLKINIKESLSPGRSDSKIILHQYMTSEEFIPLECCGTLHKATRTRKVYRIAKRQDLERLLGVGFDYRILNEQGDSFFIDTSTIRYWLGQRKALKDFLLFPDHVEEDYMNRGSQLTFSFVKKPGNKNMFQNLLNNDSI
ncbi:uncharacterized protein LOC110466641 isoform X3 [Mizuhopecten yessoensis]|uniref:uncharacterized protein LOC110449513 isoform X3 n=1 Tax=Mizuhopecten yessoensis TaxID=6573 RepID=UPI000B459CF2|nr:uncharacterized protein LOC110449513 isoform X3 [Mizuhopecten yessoensis]XP_021369767.1 uncharacterized protein LOC110460887 isoform X3 [Mizuhopecten yessoensis]XP_021378954.1 uncharacterized protein LOC110466641 isoform X3 [Mizuhopecten yessoensis]